MKGTCPSCSRSYEIGDEFLQMGGKAKCPHCLLDLVFPAAARSSAGAADAGRDPRVDPTRVLDPERPRPQPQLPDELDAHCPACRKKFKIDREYIEAGNPALCPRCNRPLVVQEPPIPQAPNRAWEEDTREITEPRGRQPEPEAEPAAPPDAEVAEPAAEENAEYPAAESEPGAGSSDTGGWGDTLQINLPELAELQQTPRAESAARAEQAAEDLFGGLPDEALGGDGEDRGPTERMQLPPDTEPPPGAIPPGEDLGSLDEDGPTVELHASLAAAAAQAPAAETEAISELGKEPPAAGEAAEEAPREPLPDLSDSPEETLEAGAMAAGQAPEQATPDVSEEDSAAPPVPHSATGEFEAGLPLSALDGDAAAPQAGAAAAGSLAPADATTPLAEIQPAAAPAPAAEKPFARLAATEDWAEAARRWAEGGFKAEDMPAFIRSDSHPPEASATEASRAAAPAAPAPVEAPAPVSGPAEVEVSDSDILMLDDGEVEEIPAPKVIVAPQAAESWAQRASVEIQKTRTPEAQPKPTAGTRLASRLSSPPILAAVLGILAVAALVFIWWLRSSGGTEAVADFPSKGLQGKVLANAPAPAEPRAREEAVKHYAQGNHLAYQGRFEDAILEYQQAVRLDPAFPHPHRAMGSCYAALGKSSLSVTAYQGYLTRAPDAPDAAAVKEILKAARGEKNP